MDADLTWGGERTMQSTDDVVELCTWNLYTFVNQGRPNKFNKN